MKTIVVLGLAILGLLLAATWRPARTEMLPGSARDLAAAEQDSIRPTQYVCSIPSPTCPTDPPPRSIHQDSLNAVDDPFDPDGRSEALELGAESVAELELPATLDALKFDASPGAVEKCRQLVRRWAESNPAAAAAWSSQQPDQPLGSIALEQVAIAWANIDLPAATRWVQTLQEGKTQNATTIALAYETARSDPVAALDLTTALSPTPARDELLVHAISQWAEADATNAAIWALNVAEPDLRQRLVAAVAVAVSERDGAAAATLAAKGLYAGAEQDRASVSIVQRWVQSSPEAAAAWVAQFPEMPARDAAVQNLVELWMTNDAQAAANWLNTLPPGSLHTAATSAFAGRQAQFDGTALDQ